MVFDRKEYYRSIDQTKKRKIYNKQYNQTEYRKQYQKECRLFRTKKVCNGCYEFIQMLNSY
jgi:hypothetical protein